MFGQKDLLMFGQKDLNVWSKMSAVKTKTRNVKCYMTSRMDAP